MINLLHLKQTSFSIKFVDLHRLNYYMPAISSDLGWLTFRVNIASNKDIFMVISGSSPTASNTLLVSPAQINYAGTHSASQLHYKSFLVLCFDTSNIKTCTVLVLVQMIALSI